MFLRSALQLSASYLGLVRQGGSGGGGGEPAITLAAPTFYDAFTYADGTRLVAGDPNVNYGLGTGNPGNLGWDVVTLGAVSNARFNQIVFGGKLTTRTASASFASKYLASPSGLSLSGNQYAKVGMFEVNGEIALKGVNDANVLFMAHTGSGLSLTTRAADVNTPVVTAAGFSSKRLMGGTGGQFSLPNRADDEFTVTTIGTTAFLTRGPGFPIGAPTGYTFTDPAGSKFGLRTLDTIKNLNFVEYGPCATKLILDESTYYGFYPKVKASASDPFTSGSATITFTGTYVGTAPSRLQWALADPITGALVKTWAWVALANQTIGAGAWSATVSVPCGLNGRAAYAPVFRAVAADDTAIGGSAVAGVKWFYVSLNVGLIGQSNAAYLASLMPTSSYPNFPGSARYGKADPPSLVRGSYNDNTNYYLSNVESNNIDFTTARLGDVLSTYLNIPISFEILAIPARGADALGPLSGDWSYIQTHHAFAGGAYEMLYLSQGENEFGGGGSTWLTQWVDTNLPAYLAMSGQPAGTEIPLFLQWTGRQSTAGGDVASTAAMRAGQDAFMAYANAQIADINAVPGAHYVGVKMADSLHYTAVLNEGYDEVSRRLGLSIMKFLTGTGYDGMGPIATTATRSGAVITVAYDLNGAASMAARNGTDQSLSSSATALTSWEVSADNFATLLTITSAELVGNDVVITLAANPGVPVKVHNHQTRNPDVTSWATGLYADGSYIGSKPIITPLVTT